GETVDTGLDENEAELAVLVLAVGLEVLADGNGLLDEHVEVLWDIGAKAAGLEDSEDLVASDDLDLGDTAGHIATTCQGNQQPQELPHVDFRH
ncbi:hypothetical protein QML22_29850, partial [Klebsiella pneumoniae]